ELLREDIEAPLLRSQTAGRGPRGLGLQRAMHPLMAAVLIGPARLDELWQDTEPHPPRRELGQATQRGGGERHAVVTANARRQPTLPGPAGASNAYTPHTPRD